MIQQIKVAVTMEDGSLTILSFLTVGRGNTLPHGAIWLDAAAGWWKREPTAANLAREIVKMFSRGIQPMKYRIVDDAAIPSDAEYRDAWVDDGTTISHHMPKARDIHLRNVRAARTARLLELDGQWMRATGTGNTKEAKRIEAERQVLRDLPMTIGVEKAATVERLKLLWPPILTS